MGTPAKEEIIKAAKLCAKIGIHCEKCPLQPYKRGVPDVENCLHVLLKYIISTEKEPASAGTPTSSNDTQSTSNDTQNTNNDTLITINDTAKLKSCQEELSKAKFVMLESYGHMSEAEQRAWDLGEAFRSLCNAIGEGE